MKTSPDVSVSIDLDLGPSPDTRSGPARRRLVTAGVAAAAVLLVPAAVVTRGGATKGPGRYGSAAPEAVLLAAASAAERAGDTGPRPGETLFIATRQFDLNLDPDLDGESGPVAVDQSMEEWAPRDTRLPWLLRIRVNEPKDPRAVTESRGLCGDYYPAPGRDPCHRPGLWQDPTRTFVAGLPRAPAALLARLRADVAADGTDSAQEALVFAAQALDRGLLPAKVRAILYRALALLPGLTGDPGRIVLDGRPGLTVGMHDDGTRFEIVLDPGTGTYLGRRRVLTESRNGRRPGTVTEATAVHTAIVSRVGEHPAG